MATASNSAVNRPDGSAHGNFTTRTPRAGHWLRGGAARFWRRGGNLPRPGLPPEGETGKGENQIPCCRRRLAAIFPSSSPPATPLHSFPTAPLLPVSTTRPVLPSPPP